MALGYDNEGNSLNTRPNVYAKKILDICANYSTLPDVRTMTYDEIDFFYEGIRNQLLENGKQR